MIKKIYSFAVNCLMIYWMSFLLSLFHKKVYKKVSLAIYNSIDYRLREFAILAEERDGCVQHFYNKWGDSSLSISHEEFYKKMEVTKYKYIGKFDISYKDFYFLLKRIKAEFEINPNIDKSENFERFGIPLIYENIYLTNIFFETLSEQFGWIWKMKTSDWSYAIFNSFILLILKNMENDGIIYKTKNDKLFIYYDFTGEIGKNFVSGLSNINDIAEDVLKSFSDLK